MLDEKPVLVTGFTDVIEHISDLDLASDRAQAPETQTGKRRFHARKRSARHRCSAPAVGAITEEQESSSSA
jgi:hypothetical protein